MGQNDTMAVHVYLPLNCFAIASNRFADRRLGAALRLFVSIGTPSAIRHTVEVEQRWPALVHPAFEAFRVTWSDPGRFIFLRGG